MNEVITFLKEWKDLVGAVIGGLFSLAVALLVAHQARRSEERASAMLLIGELSRVKIMVNSILDSSKNHSVADEELPYYFSEQLCHFRVRVSDQLEGAMYRVMTVDIDLAAHINLANSMMRDTEQLIDRVQEDLLLGQAGNPMRNTERMRSDMRNIYSTYLIVRDNADFAVRLLELFALGNWPTWHKIRRYICPKAWERRAFKMLRTGESQRDESVV
jgi:hypothetical protein